MNQDSLDRMLDGSARGPGRRPGGGGGGYEGEGEGEGAAAASGKKKQAKSKKKPFNAGTALGAETQFRKEEEAALPRDATRVARPQSQRQVVYKDGVATYQEKVTAEQRAQVKTIYGSLPLWAFLKQSLQFILTSSESPPGGGAGRLCVAPRGQPRPGRQVREAAGGGGDCGELALRVLRVPHPEEQSVLVRGRERARGGVRGEPKPEGLGLLEATFSTTNAPPALLLTRGNGLAKKGRREGWRRG